MLEAFFTPRGVASVLLSRFGVSLSGKSVLQGSSALSDKLGTAVFDPRLTITDDATVPRVPRSSPFDDEGTPTRPHTLVGNGEVRAFYYDRQTAGLAGTETTGHGYRSPESLPGPSTSVVRIAPGGTSVADLVGGVDEGLLVESMTGTFAGNVFSGDFSGNMAKMVDAADWKGFAARKRESKKRGKLRGIGISNYLETPVGIPHERVEVTVLGTGKVELAVGTQSTGQGHETSFAELEEDEARGVEGRDLPRAEVADVEVGGATRVVGVAPGLIVTDFAQMLVDNFGDTLAKRLPTKRLGQPQDIANLVAFLASDLASWITGETYVIDGGAGVTAGTM